MILRAWLFIITVEQDRDGVSWRNEVKSGLNGVSSEVLIKSKCERQAADEGVAHKKIKGKVSRK